MTVGCSNNNQDWGQIWQDVVQECLVEEVVDNNYFFEVVDGSEVRNNEAQVAIDIGIVSQGFLAIVKGVLVVAE